MIFTHLDLFSGIGGFALAARWAGYETVAFCEKEPFCQRLLAKHWPGVICYEDVRTFPGEVYADQVDLLTGGFPCQPFSCAGKKRGQEDERFLWPQMLRIIGECRPAWIVGENVAGLARMELERVCSDLEAQGYAVQTLNIAAYAVGAWHERQRLWIVAHSDCFRLETLSNVPARRRDLSCLQESDCAPDGPSLLPDGTCCPPRPQPLPGTSLLCRTDDGIPHLLDRIRGLGNAIVPQVAYGILSGIHAQEEAAILGIPVQREGGSRQPFEGTRAQS